MKYTTHLRRHTVKKCPQRIKDTPAVLFYRIPCICIVYFKRLTEKGFSKPPRTAVVPSRSEICVICTNLVVRTPKDGRGISQKQVLEYKTCPPPMYMDVHRWRGTRTYTVQQAYGKRILYINIYGIYSFV